VLPKIGPVFLFLVLHICSWEARRRDLASRESVS
jgi:hypothetical protein